MNCQRVEARLQQLLDERVDIEAFMGSSDPLARHARGCTICGETAAALDLLASSSRSDSRPYEEFFPNLADRVLASLEETSQDKSEVRQLAPASTFERKGAIWRSALVAMTLAASLLIVIGLRETGSPPGGEAGGDRSTKSTLAASPAEESKDSSTRWYPRGVGFASLSMAVLTKGNLDMRQAAAPAAEPLLERAMDAVRRVLPAWEPESTPPNSKTGARAPVLPLLV
jgi:hypothetical protein